jgi:hypothetical protein
MGWRIVDVVIRIYLNASRSHEVDMFAKRRLIVALLSFFDLASSWLGLGSSRASDNSKSKIDRTQVTNDAQVMEWKKTGPRTYEFVGMVKVPPNHPQATAAVNIDGALTFMAPPERVAPEPEVGGSSNGVFSAVTEPEVGGSSNGVFSAVTEPQVGGSSNGVFSAVTGPEPAKGLGGVTPSKGQIAR